jgi:hypothetical protein
MLAINATGVLGAAAAHAEDYRRLKAAEIRVRFAGMEVTDGVHWADQYMRDGTLKAFHMGKQSSGKWLVRNDELCLEEGSAPASCKQVWAAGNRIEFRAPGSELPATEGVLQKQQVRR